VLEKQQANETLHESHASDFQGVKILVLDEREVNREVATTLLRSWGCLIGEAADSASGLALLHQAAAAGEPYDILMMNREMPGCDDGIALQVVADPRLTGISLLLMTRFGEQVPPTFPHASGRVGSVSKPIIEARLHQAIADLTVRESNHVSVLRAELPLTTPPRATSEVRILLAEDNFVNEMVALAMLARLGFTADPVPNGARAIEALQATNYDLVLMDCEMPVLDGYEATRRIRNAAFGALNPRVPIIAVTANAMPGDRERCIRSGMDDYLAKPIDPDELASALTKWIGQHAALQEHVETTAVSAKRVDEVFDRASLMKRLSGNEVLAQRLITEFLGDTPSQLLILRNLLEAGDTPGARRQAHKLKGAAATLSAGALREVAFQAEQAAMAGQLEKLGDLLATMEGEFDRVKGVLQTV